MSGYAVGIDLGTNKSYITVYKNGKLEVIENNAGKRCTPSWVTFTENQVLTGIDSVERSHWYIRTTIFEAKRLIGRQFNDPTVQYHINRFPYYVFDDLGTPKIKIDENRTYYPEEISGYVLHALKGFAEARLNQVITRAVVTVPAYFNEVQKQATKDAAMIAGFKHVTIISEPIAAAIAFIHQNGTRCERNLLVYDFGGGTFDVTIVGVEKGKPLVRATKSDYNLSGNDIDMILVKFVKEKFEETYNLTLNGDDKLIYRRLQQQCRQAKKKLTTQYNVDIEFPWLCGIEYSVLPISRVCFEQLNDDLFKRTMTILDECLQESGVAKEDVDAVVLVGGSSRIPKVQEMLKDYFGKDKVSKVVNPDEAVAYGAAIHAFNVAGDKTEVLDFTSSF